MFNKNTPSSSCQLILKRVVASAKHKNEPANGLGRVIKYYDECL